VAFDEALGAEHRVWYLPCGLIEWDSQWICVLSGRRSFQRSGGAVADAKSGGRCVEAGKPFRSSTRARRQRSPFKVVALLVVLIVIGAGVAAVPAFPDRVSSDDANVDGHISAIAPKVAGSVAEVLVHENEPVKAGQLLVRIDARDFTGQVDMNKGGCDAGGEPVAFRPGGVPWTNDTNTVRGIGCRPGLAGTEAEVERARIALRAGIGSDLLYAKANVSANRPITSVRRRTWRA